MNKRNRRFLASTLLYLSCLPFPKPIHSFPSLSLSLSCAVLILLQLHRWKIKIKAEPESQQSGPGRGRWTEGAMVAAAGSFSVLTVAVIAVALAASAGRVSGNSEGDALYALRRSLSDPDNVLQSWDPNLVSPCTWFHITCNQDNRVTRVWVYQYIYVCVWICIVDSSFFTYKLNFFFLKKERIF